MRLLNMIKILVIVFGLVLIANSFVMKITGNVVSEDINFGSSILGILFVAVGIGLILSEGESKLVSVVKKDPTLYRIASELYGKQKVQRDINHLLEQLDRGNENPGIGTKKLFGSINYLRGRGGGRVFYRPFKDKYEILAYAIGTGAGGGKHQSERKVISRLEKLYKKQGHLEYS